METMTRKNTLIKLFHIMYHCHVTKWHFIQLNLLFILVFADERGYSAMEKVWEEGGYDLLQNQSPVDIKDAKPQSIPDIELINYKLVYHEAKILNDNSSLLLLVDDESYTLGKYFHRTDEEEKKVKHVEESITPILKGILMNNNSFSLFSACYYKCRRSIWSRLLV